MWGKTAPTAPQPSPLAGEVAGKTTHKLHDLGTTEKYFRVA